MSSDHAPVTEIVGSGDFVYQACATWHQMPAGWTLTEAVGVAVDSRDRVFVFDRGPHPVLIFDREGNFIDAWGEDQFVRPHGIWIAPDDTLYLTDDLDHTIGHYTPDGKLLRTLGTSGQASETGVVNCDYRTIQRGGPPFNQPTNLTLAPSGEMFVTDGYGNARVHKFSADGELLLSWGQPGTGPGQFNLPHGIAIDSRGRVFVADRENSRLQIFSPEGEYLDEWREIARPCQIFFDADDRAYVAEVGYHAGTPDPRPDETGGRLSIFDNDGNLLERWGGGKDPYQPGDFIAPHDIWVDSHGDIYLGEVTDSAGVQRGMVGADCPSLRKFSKVLATD